MLGTGIERVEPDGPARSQGHRAHTPGRRQVAVLTLGVDHPGPATEDGLAPQEGLDERALAPTDLAEDHHVGVGHDPLRVELEGIEDEGSAQQVVADDDAPLAQSRFGNERVRRAEVARGDLMGGHPWHSVHDNEGTVAVRAGVTGKVRATKAQRVDDVEPPASEVEK